MHFISNPNSLFIRQISFIPQKMSLKLLFLYQILFHTVFGLVQEFDSFDRKVFKNKKQKYATFDEKGIMTLDGTVNGKTNDIGYPNLDSDYNRDTCQKDQKLFFEICETQKLGAWIGLAICYESSLSQPNINPFFRTHIENKKRRRLIKVMCGERQNAIFIRREAPFVDEKSGQYIVPEKNDERYNASKKYQSFYSFSTSFSPNKLYFRMPNDTAEKRCVIFHFGGENLGKMNLTNLRREPIEEVYKEVQITEKRRILQKIVPENDTEFYNHKFTDMANRKYRLSKDQGLWLLMLDFVPAFLRVQNISMYGWLPVRIKITGQSIKPCTLDWIFLQSREVSGGLTASSLRLAYTVETGTTTSKNEDSGKSSNNGTNNEDTESKNKEDKSTHGLPGLASIGLSFKNSVSNTKGWNEDAGSVDRETESFTQYTSKVRVEQVEFPSLQGTINIEQQVLICHGVQFNIDRFEFHRFVIVTQMVKISSLPILKWSVPDADVDDNTPEGNAEQLPSIKNAKCADRQPQCTVWASKGECKKTPAFMLTQCKESCKVCSIVSVERKEKDPYANKEEEETLPCADQDEHCVAWKEAGECNNDPFLMSNICRKSCGLCIPREDFKKMKKEWRLNEGLDDYDYLYDQNNQ